MFLNPLSVTQNILKSSNDLRGLTIQSLNTLSDSIVKPMPAPIKAVIPKTILPRKQQTSQVVVKTENNENPVNNNTIVKAQPIQRNASYDNISSSSNASYVPLSSSGYTNKEQVIEKEKDYTMYFALGGGALLLIVLASSSFKAT